MLTLSASVDVQLSVALSPSMIVAMSEERLAVGRSPTSTVTVPVADPAVFVAVIVYVVVTAGFTSVDPLKATDPTPLSMLALSAPEVIHESVDELPVAIIAGPAVKTSIIGTSPTTTVTLSFEEREVAVFVAVIVYVVVTVGFTSVDPLWATEPIPWSMLTLSAPVELHESVDISPEVIFDGLAEMLTIGKLFTVMVALSVAVPAGPSAMMVYVVVTVGDTDRELFGSTDPIP